MPDWMSPKVRSWIWRLVYLKLILLILWPNPIPMHLLPSPTVRLDRALAPEQQMPTISRIPTLLTGRRSLQESERHTTRLPSIALCVVWLGGVDLGFEPGGVLAMPIDLELRRISEAEAIGLYEGMVERLSRLPGVRALPPRGRDSRRSAKHCSARSTGGIHAKRYSALQWWQCPGRPCGAHHKETFCCSG